MRSSFLFSLTTAFVALALFVLISCGTMGDGNGNDPPNYEPSSDSRSPSSSSNGGAIGSCQAYDRESGLTLCVSSTFSSVGLTEEQCKESGDDWQWISKCSDNYALRCLISGSAYIYVYGNLPNGANCYSLGLY